jgi:hypothetical protein
VYMSALAEQLTDSDRERGIRIFSRSSLDHGGREWLQKDVEDSALYRLYRATALEHWVLDPTDHRIMVIV